MTTPEIPDWNDMFPGCFNADDLAGGLEYTARIKTITKEPLTVIGPGGKPTGEKEEKWVMHFFDSEKMFVINKTNKALIGALLGKKTSAWIGKRITLHAEPNCGFGKAGVRVCGSPDIEKDIKTTLGLMPKPQRVYTLRRTTDGEQTQQQTQPPAPDLSEVLTAAGLTMADADAWAEANGKPAVSSLPVGKRATLAGWLAADPERIEAVRRAAEPEQPAEPEPEPVVPTEPDGADF